MTSVKDSETVETNLDNTARSPFQWNKTKGPVKLIPLHPALRRTQSEHESPLSEQSPATSSTSSIGTIGTVCTMSTMLENPFSFNVQKLGSIKLSPTSAPLDLLPGSSLPDSEKVIEYQKEITKLKKDIESKNKDIESKEAKLNTSVKSIKQFWSPELKKERALRKEEAERTRIIKEECQIGNNQIEEYKSTLQDLEAELSSQQEEIKSLVLQCNVKDTESSNLQNEIIQSREQLNSAISNLETKYAKLESENCEKSTTNSDLEQLLAEHQKQQENYKLNDKTYCQEYEQMKEELESMKRELKKREEELESQQKGQSEEYEKNAIRLENQLSSLQHCLSEKEELYKTAKDDVDVLQRKEKEYSEQIFELEDMFTAKDKECNKLQGEVLIITEEKKKVEDELDNSINCQRESENKLKDIEGQQQINIKDFDELNELYLKIQSQKVGLENENSVLQQKIKESEKEENNLVQEKMELEEQIDRILILQKQRESALKALESRENRMSKELEENIEEKEILIKQKIDIEKENIEFKEQLNMKLNENTKLRRSEEELREAHTIAKESIRELQEKHRISYTESMQMNEKITYYKKQAIDLEKELQEARNLGSSMVELKENLQLKTKEVNDITVNYNNLNKYLSEREVALDNCFVELTELKEQNQSYVDANEQFVNQLNEQKLILDMYEKEKLDYDKLKEESVSAELHEELTDQMKAMKGESNKLHKLIAEKNAKLGVFENSLKDKENVIAELEDRLDESQKHVDQSQYETMNNDKEELEKQIKSLKIKVETLENQKVNAANEEKPLVGRKNVWDELSRKDTRIEELEKQLKEKTRQLAMMKKNKNTEGIKQQIQFTEAKKVEEDVENKLTKLKMNDGHKNDRISLLEDALREMVNVAKERENIMARYAEVYEDVEVKYEEAEREYSRITFEKAITNIKNALLILILSERDALISSMKVSQRGYLEELFTLREERLMSSISEKDNEIAHLESQSPKPRRGEIKQLKQDKENLVAQLKEQNNQRMLLSGDEDKACITNELRESPPEQVYEAIRHLSNTNTMLESKVEELLTFLREKNAEMLRDISNVPMQTGRSKEQLKILPKDELMKELTLIEDHSIQLQKFVEDLLTLLEGDQ